MNANMDLTCLHCSCSIHAPCAHVSQVGVLSDDAQHHRARTDRVVLLGEMGRGSQEGRLRCPCTVPPAAYQWQHVPGSLDHVQGQLLVLLVHRLHVLAAAGQRRRGRRGAARGRGRGRPDAAVLVVLLLYAHWQAPTTHKSAMPPHVRLAIHALAPGGRGGAWEGRGAVGRGKRDGGGGRGRCGEGKRGAGRRGRERAPALRQMRSSCPSATVTLIRPPCTRGGALL